MLYSPVFKVVKAWIKDYSHASFVMRRLIFFSLFLGCMAHFINMFGYWVRLFECDLNPPRAVFIPIPESKTANTRLWSPMTKAAPQSIRIVTAEFISSKAVKMSLWTRIKVVSMLCPTLYLNHECILTHRLFTSNKTKIKSISWLLWLGGVRSQFKLSTAIVLTVSV